MKDFGSNSRWDLDSECLITPIYAISQFIIFCHSLLIDILGASLVQKFSPPCVNRYGVIHSTCRWGQIVFKSSFNKLQCRNLAQESLELDEICGIQSSAIA